jgi:electron transport complex protein RnfA
VDNPRLFYIATNRIAMTEYLLILLSAVFVNNIVMVKILGLCPFMGVSKKLEAAIGMGAATTFVLTLASGASYLINHYLLGPELSYLTTLSFIVVIAGIVQFTEVVVQKTSPVLYQVLGIYLPLITTNCAVLGIPLLNVQAKHNFMESIFFGLGGALGFTMVMVLFAGMRERMEGADVPAIFKGSAIAMITAGLMSLSFMGFSGLIR